MKPLAAIEPMQAEQDQRISQAGERERPRLRNWLRRQVADPDAVEDILQDVFFELVLAYRLMKPRGPGTGGAACGSAGSR